MQVSHALNPRRIARSLITVLVLSLFVTVAPLSNFANLLPQAQAANPDGLKGFYRNDTTGGDDKDLASAFTTLACTTEQLTTATKNWGSGNPTGCTADNFTGYYTGWILGPKTGVVNFSGTADDVLIVRINGQSVVKKYLSTSTLTGSFTFTAGVAYPIQIWFHEVTGSAAWDLQWDGVGSAATIGSSYLASTAANLLDAQYQTSTCQVGYSSQCPAYSPQEIYNLYGTTTDGNYWIMVGGTPSYQYVLMDRSFDAGGWILGMKATSTSTSFDYEDTYHWQTMSTENAYNLEETTNAPARISSTGTGLDAKFDSFNQTYAQKIRAVFPQYAASTYGGRWTTNNNYGFMWEESLSSLQSGAAISSTYPTGTYPLAASTNCSSITTITLNNLFANSNRCLFRTPAYTYNSANNNTSSYDPIGNNVFASQNYFAWWGINYTQPVSGGTPSSYHHVRFGFGWNENSPSTDEGSNDATAGIGLLNAASGSKRTGSHAGCCTSQTGQNAQMGFEIYLRQADPSLGAPTNLKATYASATSVNLSWTAPAATTATEYVVQYKANTASWDSSVQTLRIIDPGTTATATITGLTANTAYNFRVFARTVDLTTKIYDTNSSSTAAYARIGVEDLNVDSAFNFGGNQFFASAQESPFDIASGTTFSIEAWVKLSNTSGTQVIAGKNGQYSLYMTGGSFGWNFYTTDVTAGTGGDSTYFGAGSARANEWQHVAFTRSGTSFKFYLNGNLSYSMTYAMSGSVKAGTANFTIGGYSTIDQPFNGAIDQVRVWSSARTLSEIQDGMHRYIPSSTSGLVAAYGFNEGSGSYAYDVNTLNSIGTDLTLTGGSQSWVPVAQTTTSGPYSYVTFPRSILNANGGWKVPDSITAVTTVVVGGGGGGNANTDMSGWMGGGGGAGGYQYFTASVTPGKFETVTVGLGGRRGARVSNQDTNYQTPTSGQDSKFLSKTSVGGGYGGGMSSIGSGIGAAGGTGGSGGGGGTYSGAAGSATTGQGFAGGTTSASCCASGGGGGAGGAGGTGTANGGNGNGGAAGNGVLNPLYLNTYSSQYIAGGGAGGGLNSAGAAGSLGGVAWGYSAAANTGSGGGGGGGNNTTYSDAGFGGSGIVILRYITALKPVFTPPTIAYLNAGMTETFTTNVAQDSATPVLTRTFRWESSTNYDTGTYSLIKSGTGAANAFFSWVPQDTATSGNKYVYRVIVTDSDTAGLFIVDTSTAVYAVINGRLTLTAKSTITKTVNISKTETFTVSSGTPTYSYSLSPTSANFWLDTSTVGSPRIVFADTVTVGTYYETFTVTDSVTSTIVLPLTIIVSPPPNFGANATLVDTGTVLYLDAGISASYSGSGTTWSDLSGRANNANLTNSFGTTATYVDGSTRSNGITSNNNLTCTSPTYNAANLGAFDISTVGQCIYAPNVLPTSGTFNPVYTLQTWIKRNDTQTAWNNVICNPFRNSQDQIDICLFWMGAATINAGIYNGGTGLWYLTSTYTVPNQTWTHISVTYNGGTGLNMYINDSTTAYTASVASFTWNAAKVDPGLIMGRKWDASSTMNGSIATVRLYNRILSSAEIIQNYNATKGRFLSTQNKPNQSGKYGTRVSDTYTVTAGSETITVSFASSAVANLVWDTSTARSVRIQMQESLTAGTYFDTMTVTDIYGASSRIPIKFVISKADTLTVYIDTPTALNYTGAQANFTSTVKVVGLVNSDTGTTVSSITYRPGGLTCATGGACSIGDIGPGGGVVFITPSTADGNGKYFEAAPATWAGLDDLSTVASYCSNGNLNTGATNVGIGWGETNTAYAISQCLGGAVAKVKSFNDSNQTGYSDWFIPSTNELIELAKVRTQTGLLQVGSAWSIGRYGYWSSTEANASVQSSLVTSSWMMGGTNKSDSVNNMVRPVRQFTPCWAVDSCTALASTNKPVQAGGYAISPSGYSLSVGSLSNYETVTYQTTFATVNRIAQSAQQIPFYSPSFPETMTVYTGGGSGTGAQIFSVLGGGSASNCTFDFRKLTTNGTGTCSVQVVKLGDRNYLTDTASALISILLFVVNQPSPSAGGGPNIALTGETAIIRDPNAAPTISAVNYVAENCVGGGAFRICTPSHWEIIGAGFGANDNQNTVVKFWRNQVVTWYPAISEINWVVNDTKIWIRTVPVGATTGKILVITANGMAVSTDNWIAP